jgi:hypothetical protein
VSFTGVLARDISVVVEDHRARVPPPSRLVRMSPLTQELVGRDDLLAAIHDRLTSPATAPPRLLALHGLGGVGKTSLALEYARRHAGYYQLIWELPAEDTTLLSAGITDLAHALGYTDLADVTDPVAIVHSALATRDSPWLLLLDNAPDAASVHHVVPPAGAGDVLVTSRSAHWPRDVGVEVGVLEPQVAAELLLAGTEDDDVEAAAALAAALGSLPLALTQAAAYLRETGRSVAEYTALLTGRSRQALLGRGEAAGYRDRVASTWSLAFERLATEQPASVTLLRLPAAPPNGSRSACCSRPTPGAGSRTPVSRRPWTSCSATRSSSTTPSEHCAGSR